MAGLEAHYSVRDIEARILAAVRAAGLNPEQRLSPEELGHLTISIRADSALHSNCWSWRRFGPKIASSILELGWPARLLASTLGCRVDCLELSPDYCAGAVLLNRLTGLEDRIEMHEGSALAAGPNESVS